MIRSEKYLIIIERNILPASKAYRFDFNPEIRKERKEKEMITFTKVSL